MLTSLIPAVLARHLVDVRELEAQHRTCANVAHFTALTEVVEGFHRSLGGDLRSVSVNLEETKESPSVPARIRPR